MSRMSNLNANAIANDLPPSPVPDDVDRDAPGEPIPPRPTRPKAKSCPTYTHVGWLGVRAYQSFESYWHGDGPKPSKTHACNEVSPGSGRYKTLCGQAIIPPSNGFAGRGDMFPGGVGLGTGNVTRVVAADSGVRITCRRCKAKLAKGG